MTDTPLREAVARAMWMADIEPYDPEDRIPFEEAMESARAYVYAEADAAIALMRPVIRAETLEEAAKVAEAKGDEWTKEWRAALKCSSYLEGMSDGTDDVAAAIRALKEKPNG